MKELLKFIGGVAMVAVIFFSGCATTHACYMTVFILGFQHRVHRLAWLYVHGEFPKAFIDHMDGDRLNNAISNLRDVSKTVNGQNMRKATKRSMTGYLGVSVAPRGKFVASISVQGKYRYLGFFDTAELAHESYLAAKRELHEGCTI